MTDNAIRNEIGGAVAQLLFESGAIHVSRQQPFILAAGWASPVYVDVRIILGDPALRQSVTQLAVRYVTRCCRRLRSMPSLAQRPPGFPLRHGLPTNSM